MKNAILGAVAVVLLVAAVVFAVMHRGGAPDVLPQKFVIVGVCLDTREEVRIEVPSTETEPYACPGSGVRSVYPWYFCNNEQIRFIPHLTPDDRGVLRLPISPRCTVCGTSDVGPYDPDFPGQEPKGPDAPLPKFAPP